jgi:hypothetical protein
MGKLDICMQKTETKSMSVILYNMNSKWIKGHKTQNFKASMKKEQGKQ